MKNLSNNKISVIHFLKHLAHRAYAEPYSYFHDEKLLAVLVTEQDDKKRLEKTAMHLINAFTIQVNEREARATQKNESRQFATLSLKHHHWETKGLSLI